MGQPVVRSVVRNVGYPVLGASGGQSWSSYWASHFAALETTLFDQADLSFWAKSRSGNYFIDEYGNNAQILTPTVQLSGTSSYYRLATADTFKTGGTAWDVTFKFKLDDKSRRDCLFYNGGNGNTTKGITILSYNGDLIIYSSDGTAYTTATIACNFQSGVDYTLRFQWAGTTGALMTITVNGTAYTTSTNKGWADASSATYVDFGNYAGSFYFKGLYYSIVGTICGELIDFHPTKLNGGNYDLSVTGRPLLFAINNGTSVYSGNSTYWLDHGYSIQVARVGGAVYYFQNDSNGDWVDMLTLVAGGTDTTLIAEGSLTKHNLFPSYIRYTGDFFDRSNTTIWNDTCRASAYYSAGNPKDFYIDELNYITLKSYLNVGYKGKFYLKFDDNSIDRRGTMDEMFLYTTDKLEHDNCKALIYSRDIRRAQRDITGDYIFDGDGYAEIYLYENLGGDAEANFARYQSMLNSGSLTLRSGYNQYDVIAISQPLTPPSGSTLTINCELRVKNGTIVNLTQNVTAGDTIINVDSVEGFNVGEWVAIGDDILAVQGGSSQTRRVASGGRITEIGEATITIHSGSRYNVSQADNGQLGHNQSVIIIDTKDDITITGGGIINGNWEQQYDKEPVDSNGNEEIKMYCGIGAKFSDRITVSYLTIKNAGLHGIAFMNSTIPPRSTGLVVHHVNCDSNHDKGILCVGTDGIHIYDSTFNNAEFEDGVTFYLSNINMLVERVTCTGNARSSFLIGNNPASNGVFNDISSGGSLLIMASNLTFNGLEVTYGVVQIDPGYSLGNDIIINDMVADGLTQSGLINLYGNIENIAFNNCMISNCTMTSGAAILASNWGGGADYPDNVIFTGGGFYDHTGTKATINGTSDVTFVDFDNYP